MNATSPHRHQPQLFTGQKAAILELLHRNHGRPVPAYLVSAVGLLYSARVKEPCDAAHVIENQTMRDGRQVHGSFRLVVCPNEQLQLRPEVNNHNGHVAEEVADGGY